MKSVQKYEYLHFLLVFRVTNNFLIVKNYVLIKISCDPLLGKARFDVIFVSPLYTRRSQLAIFFSVWLIVAGQCLAVGHNRLIKKIDYEFTRCILNLSYKAYIRFWQLLSMKIHNILRSFYFYTQFWMSVNFECEEEEWRSRRREVM